MRIAASILLLASGLACGSAHADPVQKSEDIIEFFAKAANLGAARGICIGTEDECATKPEAQPQSGLDMLVNFELDSAALTADAQLKLDEFAKALKDDRLRSMGFVVEGHTDASGSESYNESLSSRRARSVTEFLLASGIEPSRISTIGLGETHPRNADPFDAINRRVEMRLRTE